MGRCSDTQLQAVENLNYKTWRVENNNNLIRLNLMEFPSSTRKRGRNYNGIILPVKKGAFSVLVLQHLT